MSNFDSVPQRKPKTWNRDWTTIHGRVSAEKREANRARIAKLEAAARTGQVQVLEIPSTVRTWAELQAFMKKRR